MDPALLEARYQRAVFRGSEAVVARDFRLRYGGRWEELWRLSEGAGEADVEAAERAAGELAALVSGRIDDQALAAAYAAYGRGLTLEGELEAGLELLGMGGGLPRLLAWGLAMHYGDDVVSAPPYLAALLVRLASSAPQPPDLAAELEPHLGDGALMAFVEAAASGEADWEHYRAIYGEVPREARVGRALIYREGVGLVVHPAYSAEELLRVLLEFKKRRADQMARLLGLHGEYEFDEEVRCGVQYLSVDGTREGSWALLYCPWLSFSRRIRELGQAAYVLWGRRPHWLTSARRLYVFLQGGEAEVVGPRGRLYDHLVELLYRYGFSVVEL